MTRIGGPIGGNWGGLARSAGAIVVAAALLGCAAASQEELAEISRSVSYRPDAAPSATLIISQEKNGGGGVHAALMITGSEQLIYDPSGSFHDSRTRRVGDVLYGASPEVVELFAKHQADFRHNAVLQTVPLTHDLAESLLARARRHGGSWPGFCAANISDVLGSDGPFSRVRNSMWPSDLYQDFAALPEVSTRIVGDDDEFEKFSDN